jgi:polyvinyl alcohol dehydrogenase (cytochrome)
MATLSMRSALIGLAAFGALAPASFAQVQSAAASTAPPDHPGRGVWSRVCATCHDNPAPGTRTATFSTISGMSPARLRETLTTGVMAPMATGLSPDDMTQLIGFLTFGQVAAPASWTDAMMCAADKRTVDVDKTMISSGFSVDRNQTRMLSGVQAKMKKADMAKLDLAWAVGFPGNGSSSGAAIVGTTMFINGGGKLLALDTETGCAKWAVTANSRNTPTFGEIDGRKVLAMSVGRDIQVFDAKTGDVIWKANGQATDNQGSVRGGVVIYKDKVLVPISASGVGAGGNANFECCVGHGALVALSAKDGSKLWEYHTMPSATYTGKVNSKGVKQRGPSGAPIWSIPVVDEKRNRVIVTTGENTSHPGTDTSDAVIAIDLNTGKEVWKFQAMALDVWNMACSDKKETSGPNCPWNIDEDPGVGRDFDFGAGAIIAKGAGGKDVILAGQKSGDTWALDAETGKKLWNVRFGEGTALGGVHWGITTDGERLFATINDPVIAGSGKPKPGVFAVDIKTGKQAWAYDAKADCAGDRGKLVTACDTKYGFSAAPMVVDGAVIAGTLGGQLFVFDSKTGKVLKMYDTIGDKPTINGVKAKGGSIDTHAISAGAGAVFVSSGYGSFGQTPGNVLIALKPKK